MDDTKDELGFIDTRTRERTADPQGEALMGTHDIEEDETWTTFRANTPSALLLAIDGTAHMSYSDWPTLAMFRPADEPREGFGIGTIDQERSSAIQSAYLLAFLDHHLRGEQEPLLDAP